MEDFVNDIGNTMAWLGLSLALMVVGFVLVDLITPGKLRQQISSSVNAAMLVGAKMLAVGVVIGSAVWNAPDGLADGLGEAAGYGALGLAVSAVGFMLLDVVLPARLRHLVNETEFDPATVVAMGAELAIAVVVAAAIS